MNQLVAFYGGNGEDDKGRTLNMILSMDNVWLEQTHDYIQWLFPNTEPSRFNPDAPLLDDVAIEAFRNDPNIRLRVLRSLRRMLKFYSDLQWITPGNHNYLRITRILKFLNTVDMRDEGMFLIELLSDLYKNTPNAETVIGEETVCYWINAVAEEKV